jgi:hypothetical protein
MMNLLMARIRVTVHIGKCSRPTNSGHLCVLAWVNITSSLTDSFCKRICLPVLYRVYTREEQ